MADFKAEQSASVPNLITVTIRSTKRRKDISIEDDHRVVELKKAASAEFQIPLEQTCLISNGSSLPNNHTLQQCSIQDGGIIHLIQMDDGLGSASKKRKLSEKDLPLGLSKVGGLEGLLKLGLASEGLVELQAQLQKKFLNDLTLYTTFSTNPVISDILSDASCFKTFLNNHHGLIESLPTGVVLDDLLCSLIDKLLKEADVQEEFKSSEFRTSIGIEVKEEKDEDEKEKKEDEEEDKKEEQKDDEDKEEKKDLELMDESTQILMEELLKNPSNITNILNNQHFQASIKALSDQPQLLQKMLRHSPGLKDVPEDDLQASIPYFTKQLQNTELYSYITNPRAIQATLDIQRATKLIHQRHPKIFQALSDCTSPDKYTQHLFSSFSSDSEKKYKRQLQQLTLMGFTHAEDNLKILDLTAGDVNSVLQYYTQHHVEQQPEDNNFEENQEAASNPATVAAS